MVSKLAKLVSTKIDNFIIGAIERRKGYIIEGTLIGSSGDDSPPLSGDLVVELPRTGTGRAFMAGTISLSQGAKEGERILYSRDENGAVQAKIYLNASGEVFINDGSDFAVKFNELKSSFEQLVADFNAHTHMVSGTASAGVVTATASPTTSPSSANIDSSKVDKVRL